MESEKKLQLHKYQSVGAIHIHTKFSDGTGDAASVSKAAKKAGLDWIIITDHNSFEVEEGFYNGVCVIKGEEISPQNDNNHYLALGINKFIAPDINVQNNINSVRLSGGFGFAAHPDEFDGRKNIHRPIKWLDKNVIPDGVEIWNWFSRWTDSLNDKNIFSLAYAYLFKNRQVKVPNPETLKWWDELNNKEEKIIPAIGGIDAHALKVKDYIIPVTIFPYKDMFKTIVNVITSDEPFSNDFETRKAQILSALKEGRNLILNKSVSKTTPQIYIENSAKITVPGEYVKLKNKSFLCVKIDLKAMIKVFCNGEEIKSVVSDRLKLLLEKVGKYRVEIKVKERGFAYSNPIAVFT